MRVPLLNASLTDAVLELERPIECHQVNSYFAEASEGELKGILGFETMPLVSTDYAGDPRSCIIDGLSTMVVNRTQVKVLAWYDNEMSYANRLIELVEKVVKDLV